MAKVISAIDTPAGIISFYRVKNNIGLCVFDFGISAEGKDYHELISSLTSQISQIEQSIDSYDMTFAEFFEEKEKSLPIILNSYKKLKKESQVSAEKTNISEFLEVLIKELGEDPELQELEEYQKSDIMSFEKLLAKLLEWSADKIPVFKESFTKAVDSVKNSVAMPKVAMPKFVTC